MRLGPSTRDGKGGKGNGGKDGGERVGKKKEGEGEEISIHGIKLVAPPMGQGQSNCFRRLEKLVFPSVFDTSLSSR